MSGIDRISDLPEAILLEIFSRLDMKEAVQTCILSKQWNLSRDFWASLPNLNFDRSMWLPKEKKMNTFQLIVNGFQFRHFVNQVFYLRFKSQSYTIPIHKFSLSNMDIKESRLIDNWLISAALLSSEELHLHIVHLNPNLILGNFKTLQLTSVFLRSGSSSESISLILENVETLIIEDCILDSQVIDGYKMLIIDAPLLKHLVVTNNHVSDYKFVIDSPNLSSIVFKGHLYKDYHFSNMPSLISADVQVETEHPSWEFEFPNCLNKILMGISNAKCLTLSVNTFQGFPELPDGLKSSHNLFHDLKFLKLTQWNMDTGAMAELLEIFPRVERLVLESKKETFGQKKKGGDGEQQLSCQCILNHLKTVEIRTTEECENEDKFIEFLTENATALEEIIIKGTRFMAVSKRNSTQGSQFAELIDTEDKSVWSTTFLLDAEFKAEMEHLTAMSMTQELVEQEAELTRLAYCRRKQHRLLSLGVVPVLVCAIAFSVGMFYF